MNTPPFPAPPLGATWQWADAASRPLHPFHADGRGESFSASRAAERAYAKQLRSVATRVQSILATASPEEAQKALDDYATAIRPWATKAAHNMVNLADKKNRQAFERAAARQGLDLRVLLHSPGVGEAYKERVAHNITLITSIVTHSRDAVAKLVTENVIAGTRAEELAKQIEHVGEVSASRARTIAATEVSKAGTALTRARAEDVGSEGYIWRTARDGDVRDSHRAMEGRFVKWSEPPTLDNMTGHAGEFPNDRCYAEPVLKRDTGTTIPSALPKREQEIAGGEKPLYSTWERQPGSPTIALLPMEPLPNADKAQGIAKRLSTYSLDPKQKDGKAAVFKSALGMTHEHADMLQKQIETLLPHLPPQPHISNAHGQRFKVRIPITGPNGRTVDVTTGWIYDRDEDGKKLSLRPRILTAYIDTKDWAQ